MKLYTLAVAALAMSGAPALAQDSGVTGDPAAGEQLFNQCQACHVVRTDDGETLAGRAGRTGPNLYNLEGRQAGTIEDYRYSSAMREAGEAGLGWNEADLVAYVQDPTGFLRTYLDDRGARGKMSYKMRSEEDAADVWAYIASLSSGQDESGS